MERVSILEFRKDAEAIISKVQQGKRYVLTYRGKPVLRLEPIHEIQVRRDDPFYSLPELSVKGGAALTNEAIDDILYQREIFADTSGFYALLVQRDHGHARASAILAAAARSGRRFVTTDYVLDETATLLKARGQGHLVPGLFDRVLNSSACRIEWMDPERLTFTCQFYVKHLDQEWSFTDCFSFWLMHELALKDALTTDKHFRQAGFAPLL